MSELSLFQVSYLYSLYDVLCTAAIYIKTHYHSEYLF